MYRHLLLAIVLVHFAAPLFAGDTVSVHWQGKTATSAALPEGFPDAARTALTTWEPFLKRADYRADVEASGRVLLCTYEKGSHADEQMRQLAKVGAWFDARFPPLLAPDAPKCEPVCATLFVLRNQEDYALLLAHVAEAAPALASWTPEARKETGFSLVDPLCGAYLESAMDLEEWSPVHELVDRAAQLLFMQRHGEQPYWLQQGVAWAAEWAFDGNIYCFPFRHEFVFAAEHGAWPGDLKNQFKSRAKKPLQMSEFALMRRGSWDAERSKLAFGCASFLVLQPADKVARALLDLRDFRTENNRQDQDDGTWVTDPLYEVPAEKQLEILEKQLGPKLMERISTFLAKGGDSFKALGRP